MYNFNGMWVNFLNIFSIHNRVQPCNTRIKDGIIFSDFFNDAMRRYRRTWRSQITLVELCDCSEKKKKTTTVFYKITQRQKLGIIAQYQFFFTDPNTHSPLSVVECAGVQEEKYIISVRNITTCTWVSRRAHISRRRISRQVINIFFSQYLARKMYAQRLYKII